MCIVLSTLLSQASVADLAIFSLFASLRLPSDTLICLLEPMLLKTFCSCISVLNVKLVEIISEIFILAFRKLEQNFQGTRDFNSILLFCSHFVGNSFIN